MTLPDEEEIARAICSDKYDSATGRIFTSLFKGPNTSVSRLLVIPLVDQWRKLAATVQKLPGRRLEKIGVIGVGTLRAIGQNYRANDKPAPVDIHVIAEPVPSNAAHALIKGKLSDGLCNTINRALVKHELPTGFDPETVPRETP
jgi:hypothetical protein